MPFSTAFDLTGRTFGFWTVIKRAPAPPGSGSDEQHTFWLCRCACGHINTVRGTYLTTGRSTHCSNRCPSCRTLIAACPYRRVPNARPKTTPKTTPKTEGEPTP